MPLCLQAVSVDLGIHFQFAVVQAIAHRVITRVDATGERQNIQVYQMHARWCLNCRHRSKISWLRLLHEHLILKPTHNLVIVALVLDGSQVPGAINIHVDRGVQITVYWHICWAISLSFDILMCRKLQSILISTILSFHHCRLVSGTRNQGLIKLITLFSKVAS